MQSIQNKFILHFFIVSILVIYSDNSFTQSTINDSTQKPFLQDYEDLQNLPFDPLKIAEIENLCYSKDRAMFKFEKGTFYFSQSIAGKITGVVFLGEGVFELKPPTEIEKSQVRRFLEKDSLSESFSAAYLRFTDETAQELTSQLNLKTGKIPKDVNNLHEKIAKMLLEERGFNLASRILGDVLNGTKQGMFLAVLQHDQPKFRFPSYYIFEVNPQATEEVSAYQYQPHHYNKPLYTLCSFKKISLDNHRGTHSVRNKDVLQITHYKMNLKLEKNGKITSEVEITCTPVSDSLRYLTFDLYHELKIDSVRSSAGDALTFIKEKKENSFSVIFHEVLHSKNEEKIVVFYSGKALKTIGSNAYLVNKIQWFPRYGYLVPATYDITFEHPKNWQVVSIGDEIRYWESGDTAFSHWVDDTPSLAATFAFGNFDSTIYNPQNSMPLKIYSTQKHTKSMRKKIAGDVANSLYIFQKLLGQVPYSHLNVVEIPTRASHSFQGIVFLSSLTFAHELAGIMEALRGHEVSHQWWGNWIGWKTYHDQWLSEGLATYSGALIAQLILDGDEIFFKILEGWRNDLLERGHIGVSAGLLQFGFSKNDLVKSEGLAAGPIWLGRRLGEKYPVDYYLITYEKAAYVIHMLRILLRDFDSGSDERFWEMLADFVTKHKGQRVTTQDFQTITEKHFERNMNWFFNQWIYGTEVPTYIYSYEIIHEKEKYWLDLDVRQEDVSPEFRMFIPVGIEFEENEITTQLIWMAGSEKSFHLGPFSNQPQKVIFNDFGGVLAHIKSK